MCEGKGGLGTLYIHSACDTDRLAQGFILSRTARRLHCLFVDISDKLPAWAAEEPKVLEPAPTASLQEKAEQHERMLAYLL